MVVVTERKTEYLQIIDTTWDLKSQIEALGGFRNELGWAIPPERVDEGKELAEQKGRRYTMLPLKGCFDNLRDESKEDYWLKKKLEAKEKALAVAFQNNLHELSLEELLQAKIDNASEMPEVVIKELEEYERCRDKHEKRQKENQGSSTPIPSSVVIRGLLDENGESLLRKTPPQMPVLINQIDDNDNEIAMLRKGIVGMIVGAGSSGKTTLFVQLALAVATGKKWLGIFPIPNKGNVFIGLAEDDEEDIQRKMHDIYQMFEEEAFPGCEANSLQKTQLQEEAEKRIKFASFKGMDPMLVDKNRNITSFHKSFLNQLKNEAPDGGWDLIILDPISRFLSPDAETDNSAATRFCAAIEQMTKELPGNPTILFGHHMNKGAINSDSTNQSAARGSSAITDACRWQANIEKIKPKQDQQDENQAIFKVTKSNYAVYPKEITLERGYYGYLKNKNPQAVNLF